MINQTWLQTFCTLVEIGHFTHTAEKLFMTQSGVSQQIKKLEQQLDTPLIIREGKSFTLTHSGQQLYQQGKSLLKAMQGLEQTIMQDDAYSGSINIKSPGSIGLKLYPYLLDIQQQHPNLVINYEFAPNHAIESAIAAHDCDIGLMTELSRHEKMVSRKVADEALVVVTSAEITKLNWPTLNKLGFIAHPDAAHHAQLLLSENFAEFEHISQFRQTGFSNQISLILEPVSRGLGFTVLPVHAVKAFNQPEKIHLHSLAKPVSESIYLCHNRYAINNNRSRYLVQLIKAFLLTE